MSKTQISGKELGALLNVHPNKARQAIDPALAKVATLLLADPVLGLAMLVDAMEERRADILANGLDLSRLLERPRRTA